jgi:hypothetical protein
MPRFDPGQEGDPSLVSPAERRSQQPATHFTTFSCPKHFGKRDANHTTIRLCFSKNRKASTYMEMSDISRLQSNDSVDKSGKRFEDNFANLTHGSSSGPRVRATSEDGPSQPSGAAHHGQTYSHSHFKVYKRRWFGLGQLVLLNIVVSWDVCLALYCPAPRTVLKFGAKLETAANERLAVVDICARVCVRGDLL